MEMGNDTPPRVRTRLNEVSVYSTPTSYSSGSSSSVSSKSSYGVTLSRHFDWVRRNWNWFSIKPVIRCSLAAWFSVVLFAIPAVERWIGVASFLILIASFLSPPADPFISVLERELLILVFVCTAWGWSCLGLKLASLARTEVLYNVQTSVVVTGTYIEAAPSVIIGVFIAIGSYFLLYIKAHQGPGPYMFACIFGCMCLDITLTTAVLYPYPNYRIGLTIFLPLSLHSAVSLVSALFIFPLSITTQYAERLEAYYAPLSTLLQEHATLLSSTVDTPEFRVLVESVTSTLPRQEAILVSVAAAGRLRTSDLRLARFGPQDFDVFRALARHMTGRLQGMSMYFRLIDPMVDKFWVSAASAAGTPGPLTGAGNTPMGGTPVSLSRQQSPERGRGRDPREKEKKDGSRDSSPPSLTPLSPRFGAHSTTGSGQSLHHHFQPHLPLHHHLLHNSLLNLSMKTRKRRGEKVVGVFESQKYLNLEARHLLDPKYDEWVQTETELLGKGCAPLLQSCSEGFAAVTDWFKGVRKRDMVLEIFLGRIRKRKRKEDWEKLLERIGEVRRTIATSLKEFREKGRMFVIEPYHPVVDFDHDDYGYHAPQAHREIPPHRHLFHCYVYQYHLIQVTNVLLEILDQILRLEGEKTQPKLHTPVTRLFQWSPNYLAENAEHNEDDDPDIIQGKVNQTRRDSTEKHGLKFEGDDEYDDDIGLPMRRDPDALPPRNILEWAMNVVYRAGQAFLQGNSLFAVKAGIISTALCLPTLIKSSAEFAYRNRFVWAIIMGQLTLARFRGDTTFGLASRIGATFVGGIIGMVMWYVSAGSGTASPYAFAAVCGVCFPFFFMVRLYAPIPPMTRIVAFLTAILVLGYSYQDTHQVIPASPGHGWGVAWRRFVLVTIGVVAAFISSLLPPTMTLRRYQRSMLSTTCTELGAIYCSVVSFAASDKRKQEESVQDIMSDILATRSKLNRSAELSTNIVYEFSLRGRWPRKRYQQILDLQIATSYSLSHLLSVIEHLEPCWVRAFLRRTRFMDPEFQGDVLAVMTMISSSLRTGNPLPQVTPCPLLDRFMQRYHGLDIIHRDAEEDFGLPRLLTLDTLQDEQYMMFCVGIATAYGFINRLDRLMLATKEIVGEQYHIYGVVPRGMKRYDTGAGPDAEGVAEATAEAVGMATEGVPGVAVAQGVTSGGSPAEVLYPLSPSVSRAVSEMQLRRGRERERKDV